MKKTRALDLLGGSVATVADAIGISSAAVSQWPEDLPPRIIDRVIAGLVKTNREIPIDLYPPDSGFQTSAKQEA